MRGCREVERSRGRGGMWKWIHSPVGDTVVGVVISMGITVMGIGLSWLIWGVMG